jgi:hypothetical protein
LTAAAAAAAAVLPVLPVLPAPLVLVLLVWTGRETGVAEM